MKTLLLFFLFAPLLLWAKPEIIKPKVKTPTSFAIVVDKQSYDRVKSSIEAYRDAIERDGLATYILVDEWENPDAIREILKKLYADKKMPLEGVALVGDVPVPMIRDAQFLTSAFKMDHQAACEPLGRLHPHRARRLALPSLRGGDPHEIGRAHV